MINRSTKAFLAAATVIVVIFLAVLCDRSISGVASAARPGQAAASTKKASEQFKNIQVLKDLPADQLYPVMRFMSTAVGAQCVDCHAGVPGAVDGEKDDKQMKIVARQMIKMTMEINKANFDGHNDNRTVTCYTCHRGLRQPVAVPLVRESDATRVSPTSTPANLPTSDQILERYVQAVGGAGKLQDISTRVQKGNIVSGETQTPFEIYAKAPNKLLLIKHSANADLKTIFDGSSGWSIGADGGVNNMSAAEASAEMIDADFSLALDAKKVFQQFRVLAPEKIADRDVYTLIARAPGLPPARLYFDEQTGMLTRVIRYTDNGIGLMPVQTDYADYRDTNGIKIPFRWTVATPGGRSTTQIEYVQQNVPIDDSQFAKPSATSPLKR